MYNVQLNSCILFGAKVEISPKGFTLGPNVIIEKVFSICDNLLFNDELMAMNYPQGKIFHTNRFGKPICNPWGNCSMIYVDINAQTSIIKSRPKNNPRCPKCSKLAQFHCLTPALKCFGYCVVLI
jgi:hypothetical protein